MIGDAPVIDAAVRLNRRHTAEGLLWSCFGESATDIAVVHTVPPCATVDRGRSSPRDVGLELLGLAGPERVRLMAGLTVPIDIARGIEELDELRELGSVCGLALDVEQFVAGGEELVLALIDHARLRGLTAIAFHSRVASSEHGRLRVLDEAIRSFPDVSFEVAAAGGLLGEITGNMYFNLADIAALLSGEPRRFAELLGQLLIGGTDGVATADRILWATGVTAVHPQPLLERFWELQMPEDLVAWRGYPELTDELKRKILASNFARKAGLDLDTAITAIPNDHMRQAQMAGDYAKQWSRMPRSC